MTPPIVSELLDRAPCGFLSFDDSGSVRTVNRTLLEMLGRQREEVIGAHVERLLTVGSRIFYQTHWFPLLRLHGAADEVYLELAGPDGERIGTLVNARARLGDGDRVFECVLMRVRERQKYEGELLRAREAAEQARKLAESRELDLQQANEELRAQALEVELQQQQLHEQAEELEQANVQIRMANAELVEQSEEAERLRAAAEDANQAKSRFLAVMSHELRTPLNAISGYVDLLDMEIHGPLTEKQRQSLDRIRNSSLHLLRLINEVLNLARIEAGMVDYHLEEVPVRRLIEAARPMIDPQLAAREIAFTVTGETEEGVRVDFEKAEQILLNLLSNAAKFTNPGGAVIIDAAVDPARPDMLLVRVTDTGIGIPADKLGSIFDPFVQVDSSRTRRAEGSGLGLAISRDLAQGMGGDLTARSRPGEGSTFTLTLPRVTAASSS